MSLTISKSFSLHIPNFQIWIYFFFLDLAMNNKNNIRSRPRPRPPQWLWQLLEVQHKLQLLLFFNRIFTYVLYVTYNCNKRFRFTMNNHTAVYNTTNPVFMNLVLCLNRVASIIAEATNNMRAAWWAAFNKQLSHQVF